jgi:hypothetical protein
MSVIDDVLTGLTRNATMRDFKHANKIFVSNAYELAPKHSYLFHVAFDVNSTLSRLPNIEKIQLGMMVKTVSLPKYTIDVKTMNAYNRPNIIQNKIKYDPVNITFHDDSADVVRDFWYDYMSHYYRDSDYSPPIYQQNTKYNERQSEHWGYLPAKYQSNGSVERILNFIKIYSLHQKRFTEYILVNPTITSFQHGQHSYSDTSGTMENTMTISYETVLYNYGDVKIGAEPDGFATLLYDKTPSPLTPAGGSTASILGPGGLLSSATGIGQNLGNGGVLGIAQAGITAARTFNKFKGQNILGMAGAELKNLGLSIISGDTNALNRLALPKAGLGNGTDSLIQNGNDSLTTTSFQYNNNVGPTGPSGGLPGTNLAGVVPNNINVATDITIPALPPLPGDPNASQTIESNNEGVANPQQEETQVPPNVPATPTTANIPNEPATATTATTASILPVIPDYSGPRIVYAPDGSSSPVDELGNVQKTLVNGSYNWA